MRKRQRQQQHEEHMNETWLIPYADLLTLLLALFVILFASSQLDSKKYEMIMQALNSAFNNGISFFQQPSVVKVSDNPPEPFAKKNNKTGSLDDENSERLEQLQKETEDLEQLKQKLDRYIEENGLTTQLETKLTSEMLMISIREHALFASGSATVREESKRLAVAISDMLAQYPEYEVEVAGHTDNVPIHNAQFESNWDLSTERALNFMKILLQNKNVAPERFRAIGYGEYRPIDTNDTPEGRARNRRVEVNIIRNIKSTDTISVPSQ